MNKPTTATVVIVETTPFPTGRTSSGNRRVVPSYGPAFVASELWLRAVDPSRPIELTWVMENGRERLLSVVPHFLNPPV